MRYMLESTLRFTGVSVNCWPVMFVVDLFLHSLDGYTPPGARTGLRMQVIGWVCRDPDFDANSRRDVLRLGAKERRSCRPASALG